MISVRLAQARDACFLAPRLRTADLQEIAAVTEESPLEVLKRSISVSVPCYSVVDEQNQALALFGAAPVQHLESTGFVWLLGSKELEEHAFIFLRQCRGWIERLHEHYRILGNYVDTRNQVHIRWLQWCGFQFTERIERHGVEQRPFYAFVRVRQEQASPEDRLEQRTKEQ
ncbi:hypothetical protein F0U62_45475 [Cystobacter fuscus]|uniref:hypothetical protein n=1 Tax=Cystobacter fuscus TaxID=43 RepID=UPI002B2F526B|nr:hypothetical protein F0U62_45475 [Cystobacter fuscus]